MTYDATTFEITRPPRAFPERGKEATERPPHRPVTRVAAPPRTEAHRIGRTVVAGAVRLIALVTLVAIVVLWLDGGGVTGVHNLATLLTSTGRISGLLGSYALLIQLLLVARLPFLEWIASFDRLTVWHKINGKITLYLILAHVGFITAGYALTGRLTFLAQFSVLLGSYPGMTAALIATILLLLIVLTSIASARRRIRYQTWFLVQLGTNSPLL